MIRTVSRAEILDVVDLQLLIRDMDAAYSGNAISDAINPPRLLVAQRNALFGAMSSISNELNLFITKIATFVDGKDAALSASVNSYVMAFATTSGTPLAILDGNAITMIKCAAVCGLVADRCVEEGESNAGMIGAGALAQAQLLGISAVRKISDLTIYNRGRGRAEAFVSLARRIVGNDARIRIVDTPAAAANDKHILCTATSSSSPLLGSREVAKVGHISCMGAHSVDNSEIAAEIFADRLVIVEDRPTAVSEGGPLHATAIDLVSLLRTERPQLKKQQTLFSSTGHAFLDLLATAHVLKRMEIADIGIPASSDLA